MKEAILEEMHQARSTRDGIARESSLVLVAQVAALVCAIVSNFLVARVLGPEGKGLIYLVQVVASVGMTGLSFGLGPAAVYYLGTGQKESKSAVASVLLLPSVLLGAAPLLAVAATWHWERAWLTARMAAPYLWMALAAIPAITLAFNIGYLCLSAGEIGKYNVLRAAPSFLFCAFVLVGVFARFDNDFTIAALWTISVIVPAAYAVRIARKAGATWIPRAKGLLRSSFQFGWRSHVGAVTQFLQHRVDVVLVGWFLPLRELGLYSLAISLAELLWYIPQAIAPILMPRVAASEKGGANAVTSLLCRVSLMLAAALSVALALASTWIIPWILPAFRPSVQVVWLLLPGVIAASVFKILSSDFNGRGRPLDTFYPPAVSLLLCAVAGVLVMPRYGIRGEALVTAAGYVLNSTLYVFLYCRTTAESVRDLLILKRCDLNAAKSLCVAAWSAFSAKQRNKSFAWTASTMEFPDRSER